MNLCGRQATLRLPHCALPGGLSGCTCPLTLLTFRLFLPRCRSIQSIFHLPPAAQVSKAAFGQQSELCSSFIALRCRRLSSVAKRNWPEAVGQRSRNNAIQIKQKAFKETLRLGLGLNGTNSTKNIDKNRKTKTTKK